MKLYAQLLFDDKIQQVPKEDIVYGSGLSTLGQQHKNKLRFKKQKKKEADHSFIGIQRGISWTVDEYTKLQEFMKVVRLYRFYQDYESAFNLTSHLNRFIKQQYNDHRPATLYKTNVSGLDANVSTNKVTAPGVIGIVNHLSDQSMRRFLYMSMGRGTTRETIGQKALLDEIIRLSVLKDGGQAGRGNIWNHIGNFGYGVETGTYYEFGVHDSPFEPSLMFARSVLPGGLKQVQNETFLTASHSAIFVPK